VGSDERQRWLSKVEKGVAYTGINIEDLRSLPVSIPPMAEQNEIVKRVQALLEAADELEKRHAAIARATTPLAPSLLAKAFRGELVPQDPNDEPASALLAKLKTEQENAATEPSRRRPKTLGKRPTMSNTDKESIKAAILKLKTSGFSFDELRTQISGDYETLKAALFELLEEPSPVVRQVFDKKAKAMRLVRVKP
jgi:type I restriction enzyme S subunit